MREEINKYRKYSTKKKTDNSFSKKINFYKKPEELPELVEDQIGLFDHKVCPFCHKEYQRKKVYGRQRWLISKYCSRKCSSAAKSEKAKKRVSPQKKCLACGNLFTRGHSFSDIQWEKAKYCSRKCNAKRFKKYKNRKEKRDAYYRRHNMVFAKLGGPEHREKISSSTKLSMNRPDVQEKIRQPRSSLTLEHRIAISNKLVGKMPRNMMPHYNHQHYPNVQRGYYDINGTTFYFRSKWEANYALYLDYLTDCKKITKWEYEIETFIFHQIKVGTRSYTPDFKVYFVEDQIEYHEVKGYMDTKSNTKLKRMAKYYPEKKIILIRQNEYNIIIRQLKNVIKFY